MNHSTYQIGIYSVGDWHSNTFQASGLRLVQATLFLVFGRFRCNGDTPHDVQRPPSFSSNTAPAIIWVPFQSTLKFPLVTMFINAKALVVIVSCALVAQAQSSGSSTTLTAPPSHTSPAGLDTCIVNCLTAAAASGGCAS